ncbi:hypothetical protein NQ314_010851 [Rhamnusium bicolor]|uniref:RecA family profile 1 domain-containing protein n=1 Tax=Rhamnusium bicolor TaxID=1586634 RepID=A0AAV8XNV0_9CUCU|nr:hypothetical protein NQ314_010851 [Rhamnusium bicolor]
MTSLKELQEHTNPPDQLLQEVKRKASNIALKSKFITADKVPPWERISTGCSNIDLLLHGGVPINGITEIFGCSGVGKTQLALQLALMVQLPENLGGKEKDALYICTEDIFPAKRFHKLATHFKTKYNLYNFDFESRVYLEHAADFEQLRRCISIRLPQLLHLKNVGLIIIDSIAGIFRSENNDICYNNRSQDIGSISTTLHNLCNKYGVGIVCINQVSENLITEKTEPCLGLAWGNNVTCRFSLSRYNDSTVREFEVIFAPDLPNYKCTFTIAEEGVIAID